MKTDVALRGSEVPAKARSRLAPIIERAPLPMVEVEGRDHVVCHVNSAFCALLGVQREELLGKPFAGIICDDPKCVELLNRVYETGAAETHAAPDEATPAYWLYAMWPALDEKERPQRVVIQLTKASYRENMIALNEALMLGSLQQHQLREAAEKSNSILQLEIAERRRMEAELQTAQAKLRAAAEQLERTVTERTAQLTASMGELEAFAYSLAHDLRAPVRAIHGFTQFVLELPRTDLSPPAAELLRRVVKAAVRMDSLIQDVLALSQVTRRPISLGPVDVDSLIRALVSERPELAAAGAEIELRSPLLPVIAHEATLSQCLTNLLSNAVKFVRPGMPARVCVWTEALGRAEQRARVRIWVGDEGIGIPVAEQGRIFEIFQRLNQGSAYEGSGIGLAIVLKATERMGGRVGVESQEGGGSRFWLELPAADHVG